MKVFVSHISEDARLAFVLKEWIESSFLGNVTVFVSSDPAAIPPGARWMEELGSALARADALVSVLSPRSLARPWINFETGAAWTRNIPILPVCHSGLTPAELPQPYATFQALEASDVSFPSRMLKALAPHAGAQQLPRIDAAGFTKEITEALSAISTGAASQPPSLQASFESSDRISPSQRNILQQLASALDGGHSPVEERRLAQSLGCRISELKTDIKELVDLGFVRDSLRVGGSPAYRASEAGLKVFRDLATKRRGAP